MAEAKKKTAARRRPAAKKAAAKKKTSDEAQPQGNEGPIPARFSGESAPEPDAVVMSEEERAEAEHAERELHNARTGGGDVMAGELEDQREEHNLRTGGFKYKKK